MIGFGRTPPHPYAAPITNPALRTHKCVDCGGEFEGPASAKRCAKCRPARDKLVMARANVRQKKKRKQEREAQELDLARRLARNG